MRINEDFFDDYEVEDNEIETYNDVNDYTWKLIIDVSDYMDPFDYDNEVRKYNDSDNENEHAARQAKFFERYLIFTEALTKEGYESVEEYYASVYKDIIWLMNRNNVMGKWNHTDLIYLEHKKQFVYGFSYRKSENGYELRITLEVFIQKLLSEIRSSYINVCKSIRMELSYNNEIVRDIDLAVYNPTACRVKIRQSVMNEIESGNINEDFFDDGKMVDNNDELILPDYSGNPDEYEWKFVLDVSDVKDDYYSDNEFAEEFDRLWLACLSHMNNIYNNLDKTYPSVYDRTEFIYFKDKREFVFGMTINKHNVNEIYMIIKNWIMVPRIYYNKYCNKVLLKLYKNPMKYEWLIVDVLGAANSAIMNIANKIV